MYSLKNKHKENTHNLKSRSNFRMYETKLNIIPNAVIGWQNKQKKKQKVWKRFLKEFHKSNYKQAYATETLTIWNKTIERYWHV